MTPERRAECTGLVERGQVGVMRRLVRKALIAAVEEAWSERRGAGGDVREDPTLVIMRQLAEAQADALHATERWQEIVKERDRLTAQVAAMRPVVGAAVLYVKDSRDDEEVERLFEEVVKAVASLGPAWGT